MGSAYELRKTHTTTTMLWGYALADGHGMAAWIARRCDTVHGSGMKRPCQQRAASCSGCPLLHGPKPSNAGYSAISRRRCERRPQRVLPCAASDAIPAKVILDGLRRALGSIDQVAGECYSSHAWRGTGHSHFEVLVRIAYRFHPKTLVAELVHTALQVPLLDGAHDLLT